MLVEIEPKNDKFTSIFTTNMWMIFKATGLKLLRNDSNEYAPIS